MSLGQCNFCPGLSMFIYGILSKPNMCQVFLHGEENNYSDQSVIAAFSPKNKSITHQYICLGSDCCI